MQSKAWPRWSDLSAALSKSGIRLSPKPNEAALEPGGAGGKQLVGRSIIYHWTDHGWCSGVIEKTNSDKSRIIDGDMVNFMVYYEVDDDLSNHVLQLDGYVPDGPANSWVLLEPAAEPETPPVRDDTLVGAQVALEAEAETKRGGSRRAGQATDEGGGDGEGDGGGPARKRKTAPSERPTWGAQPRSDHTLRRRDSKSREPEIQPPSARPPSLRSLCRTAPCVAATPNLSSRRSASQRGPNQRERRHAKDGRQGCREAGLPGAGHEGGGSSCSKPAWHEGSHDGASRGNGESTQSGQGGTRVRAGVPALRPSCQRRPSQRLRRPSQRLQSPASACGGPASACGRERRRRGREGRAGLWQWGKSVRTAEERRGG